MWDYDKDTIPKSLNILSNTPSHSYNTRFAKSEKLYPCGFKTKKFGMFSFRNEGTNLFNQFKDETIYTSSKTKKCFTNKLKIEIIKGYSSNV